MKKIYLLICAGLLGATMLTSCDSSEKLANSIQGEWTGNTERILDTGAAKATAVRVMSFSKGSTSTEGNVTMSAMITVENTMPFNDSIQTPLTITATGIAMITGVYQAKDDDELIISLDATSLSTDVDPEGVQMNYNVMTGEDSSVATKLKPAAVVLATQQINRAAQNMFTDINKIDDIKVKGNLMKCEIGKSDKDLVFSRESAIAPAVTK
ncbi:MAG: hypothetical protein HDS68_10530 [Bacteroidales bacterium]|nr:hypothetical protein [Bacteroidales bacterium]